ncbi:hypothetical protein [Roseicella aquatilis]|uniref:hypothetical protein n=1 Tax=Roseicella aquatilis TaxID=2527868 RepID=UPI00198115BE|nr:hypothetical protein [Roseicella aquatilis]
MATPASSVERVRAALLAPGHGDTLQAFPDGTRSPAEPQRLSGGQVADVAEEG